MQINASPFFSLPLAANTSDAYTAGMATAVAKQLAAGLQVYIEIGQGGPGWMTTDLVSKIHSGMVIPAGNSQPIHGLPIWQWCGSS